MICCSRFASLITIRLLTDIFSEVIIWSSFKFLFIDDTHADGLKYKLSFHELICNNPFHPLTPLALSWPLGSPRAHNSEKISDYIAFRSLLIPSLLTSNLSIHIFSTCVSRLSLLALQIKELTVIHKGITKNRKKKLTQKTLGRPVHLILNA